MGCREGGVNEGTYREKHTVDRKREKTVNKNS